MTTEELLHKNIFIRLKKSNPFLKGMLEKYPKIAIYHERSYNRAANSYIQKYYEIILSYFNRSGIAFVYFPMLLKDMGDSIRFNIPNYASHIEENFSDKDFYNIIEDSIVKLPAFDYPMILVSDPDNVTGYPPEMLEDDMESFYCFPIADERDILNRFKSYNYPEIYKKDNYKIHFQKEDDDILSRVGETEPEVSPRDKADMEEIGILTDEIQLRIQRLYAMGVNEAFVRQILTLPEAKLSPVNITSDFRLLLPDYNNCEIVLNPLPKALYFFYLRHPEGVLFKHLRDHRSELFYLYSLLSPSENLDRMNQSIDDLVDSTKNSVNVLCSRIKTAFASQFKDDLACQYYITGRAGEPKSIALDRKLVEDRSGLIMRK